MSWTEVGKKALEFAEWVWKQSAIQNVYELIIHTICNFVIIGCYIVFSMLFTAYFPKDTEQSCIQIVNLIPVLGPKHCIEWLESVVVVFLFSCNIIDIMLYWTARLHGKFTKFHDKIKKGLFISYVFA